MRIFPLISAAIIAFFAQTTLSHAQATRTWVSGVGDDANPCSRTAPCKTFAGSISKTAAGGEINVLDPGGFGAVTITKSITIRADHVEAGVLVSGTNGIVVNTASTDKVVLQGLDFEGFNTGLNGINIVGSGLLTIDRCDISNFTGNGVNLVGLAGAKIFVNASRILNNAGGVNVQGQGGVANGAFITESLIDGNSGFAVQTDVGGAVVIENNKFTRNPQAISILNPGTANAGTVVSYGGNLLRGSGVPTSTAPLQ